MSKLSCQSELMQNHKHADVMAPDIAFEVIQATTGEALFFSIGTDNVFYVKREVRATVTGWNRVDLSSTLSSQHGGSAIKVKSFAITQNSKTHDFDVALAVTIAGVDFLYLSLGNSSAPTAWKGGITWTSVPFDAHGITLQAPLTIADVYLMQIPRGNSSVLNFFVDIIQNPQDPLQKLDRYYISPNSSPESSRWNRHNLQFDLINGSFQSCLGNRPTDFPTDFPVQGIYTFGSIGGEQKLYFSPQRNSFPPDIVDLLGRTILDRFPIISVRLSLPENATAIASALNSNGFTNLFIAAPSGIYLFVPDNQHDNEGGNAGHQPLQLIESDAFAGVSSLSASTNGSRTAVWGINAQKELFYIYCPTGSETTPGSWSTPVPICKGAKNFAFYLNSQAPSNVLFVHLDSREDLIQLSQDPVTGCWSQRHILIPATATTNIVTYYSYTTHIQVTDANGVSAPNVTVSLSAATHVSVYVNNTYYVLSPAAEAVKVTADATGVVTVVQETQTLHGACFRVTLADSPSTFVDVNPMSKVFQTLSNIKSASDLKRVEITTATGATKPLLPSSASTDNLDAAAAAITHLTQLITTLPSDGSVIQPPTSVATMTSVVMLHSPSFWGNILGYLTTAAGDIYEAARGAYNDVSGFLVHVADGIGHFVVTIAGEVYRGIIDSLAAVAGAFHLILNKLEVAWEDVVAWIGFLFEWGDIVRMHKVMKNIIRLYAQKAVHQVSTLKTDVQSTFGELRNAIDGWADISSSGSTIGSHTSSSSQLKGYNTPQANWGLHQTKSNYAALSTSYNPATPTSSTIDGILDKLEKIAAKMVTQEKNNIVATISSIKSDIADKIYSLTPGEVMKKLAGIIADLIVDSAETVVTAVIELLEIVMSGLVDLLDAAIDIPVISSIYKDISGDTLTFLDLICLIGAIPATIIYKLSTGNVPYPDNSNTTALINATDFSTLSSLIVGGQVQQSSVTQLGTSANAMETLKDSNTAAATLNIAACFASCAFVFFSAQNWFLQSAGLPVPDTYRKAWVASYLFYVSPSITWDANGKGDWWVVMNNVITVIAIGKTVLDANLGNDIRWSTFSPIGELIINAVWLVPSFESYCNSDKGLSDTAPLIGAILFDLGGILAPGTVVKWTTYPVAQGIFALTEVLALGYGCSSFVTGIALATK